MQLIDTHAHLYLPEFEPDRTALVERAKQEGVSTVMLPAIDSSTHEAMLAMEAAFEGCPAMMGLHPCSVKENYKAELDRIYAYLKGRKFIAIGEIGLDFYWDTTFANEQYAAFEQQLQWAQEFNVPIAIHSRNALDECIAVVKKYPAVKGVFHCFSGTVDQAHQIIAANYMLGIGGVVTYKNAGLDKVLAEIGIDNLVLETDAPYLTPVPFRGKRNESSYLNLVCDKVAAVTGNTPEKVAQVTTQNAKKLFSIA